MKDKDIKQIEMQNLPQHIAIIMDGNGRWAEKRKLPRTMGHRAGINALKKIVEVSIDLKIKALTVYAFSTENWKRPTEEVDYLMKLLVEYLRKELNGLAKNNVSIQVLGDYSILDKSIKREIDYAKEKTVSNSGLCFNIALNYGARDEIIQGIKKLAEKLNNNEITIEDINEKMFSSQLFTAGKSDPDLLIRTAGEKRLSNFLLWQIAYTELWFTDVLWPDFNEEEYKQAIMSYQKRVRKYGGLIK